MKRTTVLKSKLNLRRLKMDEITRLAALLYEKMRALKFADYLTLSGKDKEAFNKIHAALNEFLS